MVSSHSPTLGNELQAYSWLLHAMILGTSDLKEISTHIYFTLRSVREESIHQLLLLVLRDIFQQHVDSVAGVNTSPTLPPLALRELVAVRALSKWARNKRLARYATEKFKCLMMRQVSASDIEWALTKGDRGGYELTTAWETSRGVKYLEAIKSSLEDAFLRDELVDRESYNRLAERDEAFRVVWQTLQAE